MSPTHRCFKSEFRSPKDKTRKIQGSPFTLWHLKNFWSNPVKNQVFCVQWRQVNLFNAHLCAHILTLHRCFKSGTRSPKDKTRKIQGSPFTLWQKNFWPNLVKKSSLWRSLASKLPIRCAHIWKDVTKSTSAKIISRAKNKFIENNISFSSPRDQGARSVVD